MAASYISVPRDLTKVKSKVMFNLTKRQLICFGLAALIGVPSFFLLKTVVKVNTAVMGMMVIMMPFFFLAMYEKNGQPLEVILSHMIQAIFKRPKIRPYMTDNYYDALLRQAKAEKEVENIVRFSQKERAGKQKVHNAGRADQGRAESGKGNHKKGQKNDGTPRTAQQSIPFDRMFPDGICRVGLDYYTKTIQFQDINYQLAQQEDKTEIFEEWCSFLNFFDSSINFQLSFNNMATDVSDFEKSIAIAHKKDGFDDVRDEYSEVLLHQMEAGNNGLTKTKYLTFGIHAESMKTAKPRLIHIETDILNNFKRLGVRAKTLNGSERLELMYRQFHMGDDAKFHFDWKYLAGSGLSVKDFIAPSSFAFPTGRYFQMGDMYGCMSFLSIDASDIGDRLLADFLSMESSQIVTMHIKSVDQNEAIKTIKHTITELDRSKIEEQKKAVRAGYDMDIIPSDLATYGKDAKALLKELQSQNERMFLLTFLVMNTGRTKHELENNVFQAVSIAQKHNCNLVRLDYQQEQGLMSTLPLASNLIEIQRGMTTSSTAIFVPFTTQELFQNGKEALYYGLNALSNNMIMVDRKKLKNPNALILGTPGSGKSFSAKREIANAFLVTDDDIIISNPESEYSPLVARFGGQVIKMSDF